MKFSVASPLGAPAFRMNANFGVNLRRVGRVAILIGWVLFAAGLLCAGHIYPETPLFIVMHRVGFFSPVTCAVLLAPSVYAFRGLRQLRGAPLFVALPAAAALCLFLSEGLSNRLWLSLYAHDLARACFADPACHTIGELQAAMNSTPWSTPTDTHYCLYVQRQWGVGGQCESGVLCLPDSREPIPEALKANKLRVEANIRGMEGDVEILWAKHDTVMLHSGCFPN